MNRYSLIFAALVATSFAVRPSPAGDVGVSEGGEKKIAEKGPAKANGVTPESFLQVFVDKAQLSPGQSPRLQILFATVPHPLETHLAAAFDHNVEAMMDGLQEAGYIFDSAWIPWDVHPPRDAFDDDEKEKIARAEEDSTPGILLFRKKELQGKELHEGNVYASGIVVFLLAEKPTQGISLPQAETAVGILRKTGIAFSGDIRILGPTYTGSFPSLESVAAWLYSQNHAEKVLIRSGAVTGGFTAVESMARLTEKLKTSLDFGSALHDYFNFYQTALATLERIGIDPSRTAVLSEDESYYGTFVASFPSRSNSGNQSIWKITFPRDISSLRSNYEKQGILDANSAPQPWKRFLTLKSDDQSEGDSVRSFGGTATVAAQESILFGISEFLKAHRIRAVLISATSEEDRYFLTQFIHAHNGGVRVVVIGSTRIFMRGATAQFRGDLVVDNFPMLPLLQDWTWGRRDYSGVKLLDRTATTFADDASEGTYFAAIDLFAEPHCQSGGAGKCPQNQMRFNWYPEYSKPDWNGNGSPEQRPPMYVVALGGDSAWPVTENRGFGWFVDRKGPSLVDMPFALFEDRSPPRIDAPAPAAAIEVGFFWKVLFIVLLLLVAIYGTCFWYANPLARNSFAGFEPSQDWRFWIFKVTIPALVAALSFEVLAWSVEIPGFASPRSVFFWNFAQALAAIAPLGICLSAALKAFLKCDISTPSRGMTLALVAVIGMVLAMGLIPSLRPEAFAHRDLGSILNTYREMHWESGLSLVPSLLFLLLAVLVWSSQASHGAALFDAMPRLPDCPGDDRISDVRGKAIASTGRPLPTCAGATWLWILWAVITVCIFVGHFVFRPFVEITTLEPMFVTRLVFVVSGSVTSLLILDLLQFRWLWDSLRGLLIALNRQPFRRSFVPIQEFKWNNLWAFSGLSFRDRRAVNAVQADCVLKLARLHRKTAYFGWATTLKGMRDRYNLLPLVPRAVKDVAEYRKDLGDFMKVVAEAGTQAAAEVAATRFEAAESGIGSKVEALQRALACQCGERFSDEGEEVARLPEWQQTAERLICLLYIGFIQAVVARLHGLFISVALTFSLIVLAIAIYPFVPLSPMLLTGVGLLFLIGWTFFKVFSEMDTDPVLARIVNGDDRKLQGNFYVKFAESLALPLLTLASSLLPGGAGRLLELAQSLINHGQ